jgi:hypothetical protein
MHQAERLDWDTYLEVNADGTLRDMHLYPQERETSRTALCGRPVSPNHRRGKVDLADPPSGLCQDCLHRAEAWLKSLFKLESGHAGSPASRRQR